MLHYLVMLPHYNKSKILPVLPCMQAEVAVDYCVMWLTPRPVTSDVFPPPIQPPHCTTEHRSRRTKETFIYVAVIVAVTRRVIKIGCSH